MQWGGFGNLSSGQVNSALGKTGSRYQVGQPYAGNPTQYQMTNDDRRAIAEQNGNLARANATNGGLNMGGGQGGGGGGMGGMIGGMMGGGGGGGGLGGLGGGGQKETYDAPPPGETQAQMIERQQWLRNQAQANRVSNVASIVGKIFGF